MPPSLRDSTPAEGISAQTVVSLPCRRNTWDLGICFCLLGTLQHHLQTLQTLYYFAEASFFAISLPLSISFVNIAPSPFLVGQGHHYRMVCINKMCGRMSSRRRITATNMTTRQAQSQGNPASPIFFAFFTFLRCGWYILRGLS